MSKTDNEWLGIEDLAKELGVPVRTIYSWRTGKNKRGPRAATFGKHLRFRRADVDAWIEAQMDGAPAA